MLRGDEATRGDLVGDTSKVGGSTLASSLPFARVGVTGTEILLLVERLVIVAIEL